MDMGSGQYFGERALLTSEPRAANVIALTAVKTLFISKDAFKEVRLAVRMCMPICPYAYACAAVKTLRMPLR